MRAHLLIFIGSLVVQQTSYAYEVDNFTDRAVLVKDALPVLDEKINTILQRAVNEANITSPNYCNKAMLRQEIVRWTRPELISFLEVWASATDKIQQTKIGRSDSIYRGVSPAGSIAMWFAGIGRSFKINNTIIGTDKLGHFFMQGLTYFSKVQAGAKIENILLTEHGEDGIWGLPWTGVKSYGDMAANYWGFRFWSNLYLGENSYVKCENRKWQKVRSFTFADYINDAWDEAINCSDLAPSIAADVADNLRALSLSCPVDIKKCADLGKLEAASYYISPKCKKASH